MKIKSYFFTYSRDIKIFISNETHTVQMVLLCIDVYFVALLSVFESLYAEDCDATLVLSVLFPFLDRFFGTLLFRKFSLLISFEMLLQARLNLAFHLLLDFRRVSDSLVLIYIHHIRELDFGWWWLDQPSLNLLL